MSWRYKPSRGFRGACYTICLSVIVSYLFLAVIFRDIRQQLDTSQYRNTQLRNQTDEITSKIGIVMVVTANFNLSIYEHAIQSVRCYSQIQNYQFILAIDNEYNCSHTDKFFRRHCIVAKILPSFDTIMFLDADIGVVNPKRRIEEYMDDDIDVILYDRFYNWEIAAGSYIARNTTYALNFLNEFADYQYKLPKSFHGTDNGALHLFVAEHTFPNSVQLPICRRVYNLSKSYDDLFTYEACIRSILGESTDFGKLRIMKKGTGWVKDRWLTDSIWHPDIDFMLHGWKEHHLTKTPEKVKPNVGGRGRWYNPVIGSLDMSKCTPGNTTWNHDKRLIGDKQEILNILRRYEEAIEYDQMRSYARIPEILNRTKN